MTVKKALIALLAIIIAGSSTGCSQKTNGYVESAKKHGYFTAFNISYGMTIEECKKALNMKPEDIEEIIPPDNEDGYESIVLRFKTKLEGKKVDVILRFNILVEMFADTVGLHMVEIYLEEPCDYIQTLMQVYDKIETKEILNYRNSSGDETNTSFENVNTLKTLPDVEVRAKSLVLANQIYGRLYANSIGPWREADFPIDYMRFSTNDGVNLTKITFKSKTADVISIVENRYPKTE